jgi:Tfp pilus assembly protein PilO
MLSLGLEIAFAVLLITAIGYAVILNRKLGSLRQHKEEIERLAMNFSQSTIRAEDGVQRLKSSTSQMKKNIAKAQSLRDDLVLLIERGSLTADRLEGVVRKKRTQENELNSSVSKKIIGPVNTVSDEFYASGASVVDSIKTANKLDTDHKQGSLNEQRSQAEKDLIEALRQAR